jgi:hypothetical protein
MRTVHSPSGDEWKVGRRWAGRATGRPKWRRFSGVDGFDAAGMLDFDSSLPVVLGLIAVAVLTVFVLIPLLLFGIELIALGLVISAGIFGRMLLGRPWTIEATNVRTGETRTWHVSGWRQSASTIDDITSTLSSGGALPPPVG